MPYSHLKEERKLTTPGPFILSFHCQSRRNCHLCRDIQDPSYRQNLQDQGYQLPGDDRDFDCPFGGEWGSVPEDAPIDRKWTPCTHRGEATGKKELCESCRGKVYEKVYNCSEHGSCVVGRPIEGLGCCATCADFEPQSALAGKKA